MNKKIIKFSSLFSIIMILLLGNINAIQSNSLNITTLGLEELTIPKNISDCNLKFDVRPAIEEKFSFINVKVEYYTSDNILLYDKTNEFNIENSSIVEFSGDNAINTFNLKEGEYYIQISFTIDDKIEVKRIPLKVLPEFENIILKVDDNFVKDYTHGSSQPVIIPVEAYGIDVNNNEYKVNDDLLEIEAYFCDTMNLKLWNNNGVYTLSLNCNELDMDVGEYNILFSAKKYDNVDKMKMLYETSTTTKLYIKRSANSIEFDREKIEIEKGKSEKLNLNVLPENAEINYIEWKSEDESIVKVIDGNIEGINIGSTIISAKMNDKVADILVIVKPVIFIEQINIKDIIDSLDDQNQGQITLKTNNNLYINQEILFALSNNRQKDLLIMYEEEGLIKYSWNFHGTYMKENEFHNIPLEITTSINPPKNLESKLNEDIKEEVMYLNFKNEGEIPCDVDISVYVGDKYSPKENLLLYYYNEENNELELKSKKLKVNDKGMITFEIDHCSTYVVSQRTLFKNSTIKYIVIFLIILLVFITGYIVMKKKSLLKIK